VDATSGVVIHFCVQVIREAVPECRGTVHLGGCLFYMRGPWAWTNKAFLKPKTIQYSPILQLLVSFSDSTPIQSLRPCPSLVIFPLDKFQLQVVTETVLSWIVRVSRTLLKFVRLLTFLNPTPLRNNTLRFWNFGVCQRQIDLRRMLFGWRPLILPPSYPNIGAAGVTVLNEQNAFLWE